eukprot:2946492-Amphidinium_carterae.1
MAKPLGRVPRFGFVLSRICDRLEALQCAAGVRSWQSTHTLLNPRRAQLRVHSCATRGMSTSGTSTLKG